MFRKFLFLSMIVGSAALFMSLQGCFFIGSDHGHYEHRGWHHEHHDDGDSHIDVRLHS